MTIHQSATLKQKLKDFSTPHAFIASGCFSGLSPVASGTTGSAAAVIAWYLLFQAGLLSTLSSQLLVVIIITVVGLYSTDQFLRSDLNKRTKARKEGDPGVVVIDEWSGMMITLLGGIANSASYLLIAFLLFRAFDVLKPGPVDALQRLPGTWGVMLDDIGAGILALIVMQMVKYLFF